MNHFHILRDWDGEAYMEVEETGADLLYNPILNKGTAFTDDERREFGLIGLLPAHISTMDEQVRRVRANYVDKTTNLERYIHLRSLQSRNETLFYALVAGHLEEMVPIIYTPTVGEACQKGSRIFRETRGLYISPANVDMMSQMAIGLPLERIEIIVVTDNQGILGIGDQGAGGMNIPIGKLSLYTLGAGIPPWACLPICLDVGTDNEQLLTDPLYLGMKRRRITNGEYDEFIGKFVDGVKKNFPNALLQWEDFSKQNAFTNLDVYRNDTLSFNDDVQGTGAVVLSGLMGAMKITGGKLTDQKFTIFGAGAGGIGVTRQIRNGLMALGLTKEEAGDRIYVVDSKGVVTSDRTEKEEYKLEFAVDRAKVADWKVADPGNITLEETVRNGKVTVLLGLSGQPRSITQPIVDAMMRNTPMPVIFPLSNPTSKCEAHPMDIYKWTNGKAVVATGSPFTDVTCGNKTFRIGQGNNAFIFPGVGMGAIASKASILTDEMFTAAAFKLAELLPADAMESHCVFPRISELASVSQKVAVAVFNKAVEQGVAKASRDSDPADIIRRRFWRPDYLPYKKVQSVPHKG